MKQLRVLFYGFRHGHINGLYRKVQDSPLATVAGCIEPNWEAREAAENNLGAAFSEDSYETWLSTDIDAVAIGCAYGERGDAIIRALRAGKHVIADKPICTTPEQLKTIRALVSESGCKVACMLDLRYLPQVRRAKEILDSGRLGTVRNIAMNGQHCIDYAHRPAWYFEPGMHGGTVNDLAIHGIDLVRMLTGQEFVALDGVRTWNAYATKNKEFPDSAVFMARLEGGAEVLADVSYSAPSQVFSMPTYWEFRVWCDKGLLTWNFAKPTVTLYEEGTTAPITPEGIDSDQDYLWEFAEEIETNSTYVTESVLRSTETALWIQSEADREVGA